jgi:proline iminopeptidase
VHGGPGGGCNPLMRRYHDPKRYRIILFDQRGCGRSAPHASLEENTTWDLVADMERLRQHLNIERWQLLGGSWGSTLSLLYAEMYPERVSELILRGVCMLRQEEMAWFYEKGCNWLYPDAYEDFLKPIPPEERGDIIAAYYKRLTHPDRAVQLEAARAWSTWEGMTLSLRRNPNRERTFGSDNYAIAFARIECHYFINGGFLKRDNQIVADAGRIKEIPGRIVNGRFDVVTPVKSAWDLKQAWPRGDLRIVPDAGHAMTEPGIIHELVDAANAFANLP